MRSDFATAGKPKAPPRRDRRSACLPVPPRRLSRLWGALGSAALAAVPRRCSTMVLIAAFVCTGQAIAEPPSKETHAEGPVVDDHQRPPSETRIPYDLRLDLVDAETGRPVRDAAILYKDDETFWDSEFPYETDAVWSAYLVLENGRLTFRGQTPATLGLAHILVLATGYEPRRLKLNETLERGRTLMKRVEMKPRLPVELTIIAPDGKSAAGATFQSISPTEFTHTFSSQARAGLERLLNIPRTSDGHGLVQIRYPAFGDWAAYRVLHSSGYGDFKVKNLPAAAAGETSIRRRIELAPYATIQGKYVPQLVENEFLEVYRLQPDRMSIDGPAVVVELGDEGRFELGRRLAGWYSFVHRSRYTTLNGGGTSAVASYGPFQVTAGQTVRLTLGDAGRPVVGRLVLPAGFSFAGRLLEISVDSGEFPGRPQAPADVTDDKALAAWWDAYWESDAGRRYREYMSRWGMTAAAADGRFRFPMLRPGKYSLHLVHTPQAPPRLTLSKTNFQVPDGYGAEPLDLGGILLKVGP